MSLPVTLPLIDHLALRVRDLRRSRTFYEQALEPFGVKVVESSQGLDLPSRVVEVFWIEGEPPAAPVHVAFAAADRATVDTFHRAAVEAGGRDNGAPGLRPHYHAGYYAASSLTRTGTTSKRSSTGTASYQPRDARLRECAGMSLEDCAAPNERSDAANLGLISFESGRVNLPLEREVLLMKSDLLRAWLVAVVELAHDGWTVVPTPSF